MRASSRHRAGEGVVAAGGRAPLGFEDRHRQQEGTAVDRGVLELLREGDRVLLVQTHAGALGPCLGVWGVVDQDPVTARRQQRLECAFAEHVVCGHEQERPLLSYVRLGRSERCPVTPLPVLSQHGTCPTWRDPVHDGCYGAGLVADDDDDSLDPCRKQVAYGATSQAEAADTDEGFRAPAGHVGKAFRPSSCKDDGDPGTGEPVFARLSRNPRPGLGELGESVGHAPPAALTRTTPKHPRGGTLWQLESIRD